MSNTPDNEITDQILSFYDQLTKETCTKVKNSEYSKSILSGKSGKSLKIAGSSGNLKKTLKKVNQKQIDKKKAIRKRAQKEDHLKKKEDFLASNTQDLHKTNIDLPSVEKNESIDISVNKYVNILKGMEDPSESCKSEKLYISCKPQDGDSLLVTLFPNSKIYLIGFYALQVLIGDISVLGYKFKKNEKHVIYSPSLHSILSINSLEGCKVKKLDNKKIKDLSIPLEYVQDLNIDTDQPVVIVKIHRYYSNITKILDESGITVKENKLDVCLWKETLNVQLVEEENNCRASLMSESEEWTSCIDDIQTSLASCDKRIFVITGGKGVGKSTFLKYIINRFLSIMQVPSVACIDLDPGQPEFSLPGCLSLSVCSSPLLGPSFSHHENYVHLYQKQILIGDIAVNDIVHEYLSIVSYLFSIYREKFSDIPLVINTMGFTAFIGYDIMVDILRILEPSHVINIKSDRPGKNYPTQLTSEIISSTNRSIRRNFRSLNYDLFTLKSISKETRQSNSRIAREISIMGYLSLLWKRNEPNLTCFTLKTPLVTKWRTVAVHIHRSTIPPSHVFLAINASLVALCRMGREFLYRVDPSHPLQIHYNIPSLLSCECLGWGVVRGIDPITQEISIYTPLDISEFRKVNVVAMPNVHLPVYFRSYFSTKNAPYVRKV